MNAAVGPDIIAHRVPLHGYFCSVVRAFVILVSNSAVYSRVFLALQCPIYSPALQLSPSMGLH